MADLSICGFFLPLLKQKRKALVPVLLTIFLIIPLLFYPMGHDIQIKVSKEKKSNHIFIDAEMLSDLDADSLFLFVSNPSNDVHWRNEVLKVIWHADKSYSEISRLSSRLNAHELIFIRKVEANQRAFFAQTLHSQDFFQKVFRQVLTLNNDTRFVYKVEFDQSIINKAMGFSLPFFLVKIYIKKKTKRYLRQLTYQCRKKHE